MVLTLNEFNVCIAFMELSGILNALQKHFQIRRMIPKATSEFISAFPTS
jgi:hypothetical protein